jgi:serine/threonine-protein kinase RsbW
MGRADQLNDTAWLFPAVPQAVSEARQAIRELAERHRVSATVQDAMALCVTEAVANVVVHAYRDRAQPGEVEIEVRTIDHQLCLHVRDHGHGLQPSVGTPGLGLGLPLMASLSECFEIHTTSSGGTELVMHFPLPAST